MSCPAVIEIFAGVGLPAAAEVATPGPPGAIGSRWLGGTTAPASNLGVAGDWYIRSNGDVYGPKTSAGWGSVVFNIGSTSAAEATAAAAAQAALTQHTQAADPHPQYATTGLAAGLSIALG